MPYAISFKKSVPIADPGLYINDCCVGGDVVLHRLLPDLRARYADIHANQEDWGWFAWFKEGSIHLAVDIFTEDSKHGAFKIHLTASRARLLFGRRVVDAAELEVLRERVVANLNSWPVDALLVEHLDENHIPDGTTER